MTTITSIVQQTSLVPIFPTPILTTVPSGLPSLSPVLPTSASGLGPVPSPLPGPVEIILAIVPTVAGRMLKRDLGGFISDVGSPNPKDCRSATVYTLDSGRLLVASRPTFSIFADAGTSFTEFRSRESLTAGANIVDTTFLNDNGVLRWRNALFSGGEAGFCQVAATGQVYTTYVDSPTLFPAGCLPVTVSVIDRKIYIHYYPEALGYIANTLLASQCVGGSTTSGLLPSTTSIATPVGSTQSAGPSSDLISTTSAEPSSGGFSQSITPISDLPSTSLVEPSSPSSLSQATAPFSNTTGIPSSALPTTSVLEPSESSSGPESSASDSSNPDTSSNPSTEVPSSGAPTSSSSDSTTADSQSSLQTSLSTQGTSDFPTSTTDSTQTLSTSESTASTLSTDSSASSPSSDSTQFSSYSDSTLSTFSTESTSTFFFANSSTIAP